MELKKCSRVWDCLCMMFTSFWKQNAKKRTSEMEVLSSWSECATMVVCDVVLSFGEFGSLCIRVFACKQFV